jgi:hypothetical protein
LFFFVISNGSVFQFCPSDQSEVVIESVSDDEQTLRAQHPQGSTGTSDSTRAVDSNTPVQTKAGPDSKPSDLDHTEHTSVTQNAEGRAEPCLPPRDRSNPIDLSSSTDSTIQNHHYHALNPELLRELSGLISRLNQILVRQVDPPINSTPFEQQCTATSRCTVRPTNSNQSFLILADFSAINLPNSTQNSASSLGQNATKSSDTYHTPLDSSANHFCQTHTTGNTQNPSKPQTEPQGLAITPDNPIQQLLGQCLAINRQLPATASFTSSSHFVQTTGQLEFTPEFRCEQVDIVIATGSDVSLINMDVVRKMGIPIDRIPDIAMPYLTVRQAMGSTSSSNMSFQGFVSGGLYLAGHVYPNRFLIPTVPMQDFDVLIGNDLLEKISRSDERLS